MASHSNRIHAADAVVAALVARGTRTFFGVPGGAISPVYDALRRTPETRVIHTRHESAAAFIASGFARIGGGVAGVLVTSGPGATNLMTGLAAAKADGAALVAVAGEVPRSKYGKGALQEGSRYELDILGMAERTCKFAREICAASSAATLTAAAHEAARAGRNGPAFLLLPLDVANELVAAEASPRPRAPEPPAPVDDALLDRAARALENAERPLLLLGSGARHPRARAAVEELAARLDLPVATSPKAKGVFPESAPASLGVFGHGGHRSATDYVRSQPDVVLAVGAGLGETSTNNGDSNLQATSCFIHIDVDLTRIGKVYEADLAIVGRAEDVLPEIAARVRAPATRRPLAGVARELPPVSWNGAGIQPAAAIAAIQRGAPADTIFTADIGEHLLFAIHHLAIDRPDGFFAGIGLGSMGSGLCGAIGVRLAAPNRPVVSISGDFGFSMFGMEVATCVHENIGVVFVVFNDRRMNMVAAGMTRTFGDVISMEGAPLDFAGLARALGARGVQVATPEALEAAVRDLTATSDRGPAVIDARIDPEAFPNNARVQHLTNFLPR